MVIAMLLQCNRIAIAAPSLFYHIGIIKKFLKHFASIRFSVGLM